MYADAAAPAYKKGKKRLKKVAANYASTITVRALGVPLKAPSTEPVKGSTMPSTYSIVPSSLTLISKTSAPGCTFLIIPADAIVFPNASLADAAVLTVPQLLTTTFPPFISERAATVCVNTGETGEVMIFFKEFLICHI